MDHLNGLLKPDHPIYTTPARRGWRKYNRAVSALSALSAQDAAALIKRNAPQLHKDDHLRLARAHALEAGKHMTVYSDTLDDAALQTFGRKLLFHDYRISTIGCEEFSEGMKEKLRASRTASQQHADLADAHFVAAGKRLHTAIAERKALMREETRQ